MGKRSSPLPHTTIMRKPRYRAANLDGLTIVFDLARADYLAIPLSSAQGTKRQEEVAGVLGTPVDDIRFTDPHVIPRARQDLDTYETASSEAPRLRDWIRLIASMPTALWALRIGHPASWLPDEGVRTPAAHAATVAAARRFRSMRPFVPKLSRCLPHSLLLRSYLSASGHQSVLVIGVRQFPFEAHSWVQVGDVVLTDDLEQTAAFVPIAVG